MKNFENTPKKLITAKVSFDMVIAVPTSADNDEIRHLVKSYINDAVADCSRHDFFVSFTDYQPGNAFGWDETCIAYNGNSKRIGEYSSSSFADLVI